MKLNISLRAADRKSEAKQLRNRGRIPAVIYVRGNPSETISVDAEEFGSMLRGLKRGRLSTTRMSLKDDKGKERSVILKDIQYHVATYDILHLDFEELIDDVKVNVNVPIECIGEVDCVGIKLGGVLRQVIRNLRVECYPKDMPEFFELDIRALEMRGAKKLSDLTIPSNVRPLADLKEVAVVIAKR